MTWPFGKRAPEPKNPLVILREIAEARQAAAESELAMWRACAESAAARVLLIQEQSSATGKRYDDLLARYHLLKLQGFTEPVPERVVTPPTVTLIMQAINIASAGKDHRVRAAMLAQVETDRANEMSEADIIARIQRGNRPAEEVEV